MLCCCQRRCQNGPTAGLMAGSDPFSAVSLAALLCRLVLRGVVRMNTADNQSTAHYSAANRVMARESVI